MPLGPQVQNSTQPLSPNKRRFSTISSSVLLSESTSTQISGLHGRLATPRYCARFSADIGRPSAFRSVDGTFDESFPIRQQRPEQVSDLRLIFTVVRIDRTHNDASPSVLLDLVRQVAQVLVFANLSPAPHKPKLATFKSLSNRHVAIQNNWSAKGNRAWTLFCIRCSWRRRSAQWSCSSWVSAPFAKSASRALEIRPRRCSEEANRGFRNSL